MLTITETAAAKFKEMVEKKKNAEDQMLRISFAGHG